MSTPLPRLPLQTPDGVHANVARIRELFPNCVTETRDEATGQLKYAVDFDQLRQELSGEIVEGPKERYQLTWPGKRQAILTANAPIRKTLRPAREESVDFDTTQNLFIEGDNLDALKLLQETYLGKVKMIYIDPPYNTGKDFVYRDNFTENTQDYLERSGQRDEEGNRLQLNSDSNGRYHSNWLTMMYSRLKIARNLLTQDGVLLISIDDNEFANLFKICEEVFGGSNFVENYIYVWESTFRPDNSSSLERENAQYIVGFCRAKNTLGQLIGQKAGSSGLPSLTKSSMKPTRLSFPSGSISFGIEDGVYQAGDLSSGYTLHQDAIVKDGKNANVVELTGPVIWSQANLEAELREGTEIIIKTRGFIPYTRKSSDSYLAPNTIIPKERAKDVLAGTAQIKSLFGESVFTHPKPVDLIEYLASMIVDKYGIYLDFFSGSGTTGNAIMSLNAKDQGGRRFICVQIPEDLNEALERAADVLEQHRA